MKYSRAQVAAFHRLKSKIQFARKQQRKRRCTIDFETKCELDIQKVGAFVYSRHPSCSILMLSYNLTGKPEDTRLWLPGDKPPRAVLRAIKEGAMVNAFNTYFEYCIWQHVAVRQFGWPALPHGFEQTLDVADKLKAMAMPANLYEAALHSHIPQLKDAYGKRLINLFCIPQKKGKYKGTFTDPTDPDHVADWEHFKQYCIDDTAAEVALDNLYPDLDPTEQLIAWMTKDINWRGLRVDTEACEAADYLTIQLKEKYNAEIERMSEGVITRGTQRERVKKWLAEHGCKLPSMRGPVIQKALREEQEPDVKRMLELYQITGSTSASKFGVMLRMTDSITKRIHELINYHKARTGRYGGLGVQFQNLPRPKLPDGTDYPALIRLIKKRDLSLIEAYTRKVNKTIKKKEYQVNVAQVLFSAIRSVIVPDPGRVFRSADYSAIECRKLMWLAGEEEALETFRRKEDIYLRMAETIYGIPYAKMTKKSPERPLSKEVVLGAGYQMWAVNFRRHVDEQAGIKISLKESERVINAFRDKYDRIPVFWEDIETAAKRCVDTGKAVYFNRFKFYLTTYGKRKFLVIRLPSGHKLYYPSPRIELVTKPKRKPRMQITYFGFNSYTNQWTRLDTYGGKLTENVTQASARDLLTFGMLLLHVSDYRLILTVHDEVVSEDRKDFNSLEELEEMLCTLPKWARGMPVESEGWEGYNYRK